MAKAASELSHFPEYDYVVVNEDLDESIARVRAILMGERQRRERVKGLIEFVRRLQGE
jgi:guanylate kinase